MLQHRHRYELENTNKTVMVLMEFAYGNYRKFSKVPSRSDPNLPAKLFLDTVSTPVGSLNSGRGNVVMQIDA